MNQKIFALALCAMLFALCVPAEPQQQQLWQELPNKSTPRRSNETT